MGLLDRLKKKRFPNGEKDLDFYAVNIVKTATDGVRASYNTKILAYEELKIQYEGEHKKSPSEDIDKRFYANLISKITVEANSFCLYELFMGDEDEKSVLLEHIPENFSLKNRTIYKDEPFDRAIQALLFANFEDKDFYERIILKEERLFELPENKLDIIDYYFNEVAQVELGNEYDELNERLNKTLREQAEYRTSEMIPTVIKKAEDKDISGLGNMLLTLGMDKYKTVEYMANLLVNQGEIRSEELLKDTLNYILRNNEANPILRLNLGMDGSETVDVPDLYSVFFHYLKETGLDENTLEGIQKKHT